MNLRALCLAAPALIALPASAQLLNGGFEDPNLGFRTVIAGETYGSWTNAGPSNIEFVKAEVRPTLPGLEFSAYEGSYWIDLVGTGAPSAIYQDVATLPGTLYEISFALAGNPWSGPQIMNMDVLWNGGIAGSYSHDTYGHTGDNMGWTVYTFVVTGTGNDRLMFRATSGDSSAGPAIDAVTMTIVPAPGTLALASLLGLAAPRRRRA
jgi:hypothetical protein